MLLSLLILANQTAYKDRQLALFVRSLGLWQVSFDNVLPFFSYSHALNYFQIIKIFRCFSVI